MVCMVALFLVWCGYHMDKNIMKNISNILIVVRIIWTKELKIFLSLHDILYSQPTAN
jgi:hypothetical protein